jgi:hypothetical protein
MKHFYASAILLFFPCFVVGGAQTNAPASPISNQQAAAPAPTARTTFHSVMLDFTLAYPSSMTAEKLPSPDEQHAQTLAKYPNESEESKKSDACTDVVLKATRQDSPKTTGTIAFYNDARGMQVHIDPTVTAKIIVSRIGISCLSDQYRNNPDDVAIGLAQQITSDKDLKVIDQPGWYDFGKVHIHFAAAQNTKLAEKPEDQRWILSTAFISNGNVVSVYFESNSLDFLNEMIRGEAIIGNEQQPRFCPADIGNGPPVVYKP